MRPAKRAPRRAKSASVREGESARERILAAALREFADEGYTGASTSVIAAAAGVTQPMVHYHWKSKDALWRAVVTAVFEEDLFADLDTELRDLSGPDALKVFLRRLVRSAASHPEFARLMAREGARPGPRLRWMVREHLRKRFDGFTELLRRGIAESWAKELPVEHVAFFVIGASVHLSAVPALAKELYGIDSFSPATLDEQSEALVELVLRGLIKNPE